MDVSENRGTPKSSILIGFSIVDHLFWGTTIFGNTHIVGLEIKEHMFCLLYKKGLVTDSKMDLFNLFCFCQGGSVGGVFLFFVI